MVGEANAAIEGAFEGGATEVVVNDSHGGMYNLPAGPARSARARSSRAGSPGRCSPARGRRRVDVALFVGYHARAGHPTGTIAHTYTYGPTLTRLDGRPRGRAAINASVLGAVGRAGRDGERRRHAGRGDGRRGCPGPSGSSSRAR